MANKLDELSSMQVVGLALQKAQTELQHLKEPIAIIGLSCHFPGASSIDSYWDLLHCGRDATKEIPPTRWDVDAYYDADAQVPGKMVTRKGGFIEGIDQFDATFFSISPREATYLDPQHRLLLEQTWQALEHAAIMPASLKGTPSGVFIGISTQDYSNLINHYGNLNDINAYIGTGNAFSAATGRLSYTLGLQGPNMAIETACSSSLVAIHEACKSLQRGECNLAITGGVNALLAPETFINFSKAGMLAPDGHCKTFDARADGYARGEGCGIVILKRLSDALRDGDKVLAVIKASGINQDGASSGLTVPNGAAQEQLLTNVLNDAKLKPSDIDYIECHGTGTRLGDPIEVHAIGAVYGVEREQPLKLGSVKTNLGHLEAAAGVAGFIKIVLALQHEEIPKTLHFETLNPHIELNFPAEIAAQPSDWSRSSRPRRAGVSAFGFSGTNAHIILEEAPVMPVAESEAGNWVLCLSAKTETALSQMIQDYIHHLDSYPDERIQDIVYTANTGRAKLEFKAYFKAATRETLLDNLKNNTTTDEHECTPTKGNKISLPTYPFEGERHWLETIRPGPQGLVDGLPFLPREYVEHWEKLAVFDTEVAAPSGSVLLISETQLAFASTLATELSAYQVPCTHANRLTEAAPTSVETIVFMLAPLNDTLDVPSAYREQLHALFDFTKALIKLAWIRPPQVWIVTQEAQPVVRHDEIDLSMSGVMGFYKSFIQEHPEFQARLIDIEPCQTLDDANRASHQFYLMWAAQNTRERIWACRDDEYYVQRLVRWSQSARIEQTGLTQAIWPKLIPEQDIIIIGGLGGIGYALAGWCIAHGALRLVLTGRQPKDEIIEERLDALASQNATVQVRYEVLDIMNQDDCIDLMKRYPQAQIVFNTAGIIDDATLDNLTWDAMNRVLSPKVDGSWHLQEALQAIEMSNIPLVSFSSMASILGSGGQAHYAAANGFLNALAAWRAQHHQPGVTVAWGPWADVGMAKNLSGRHARGGVRALKPDVGFEALWRLLETNDAPSTVMVADIAWDKLSGVAQLALLDNLAPKSQVSSDELLVYLEKLAPDKRLEALRDKIRELVAGVMGMSAGSVPDDKGFFELGMDSLMAVELKNRIDDNFSAFMKFKQSIIFEENTVNKLATVIQAELSHIDFSKDNTKLSFIEKIEYPIEFELSQIQKRFYFSDLINRKKAAYNISMTCRFNFNLDLTRLITALQNILNHHSLLRSRVSIIQGLLYSIPDVAVDINEQIHLEMDETLDSMFAKIDQYRNQPFILDKGPLIRFVVYKVNQYYYLQTVLHHVICDGLSGTIYLNLLSKEYHGQIAPDIKQYSEFVGWFKQYQQTPDYKVAKEYWASLVGSSEHKKFIKQTNLDIQIKTKELSVELTDSIRYFCKTANVTLQPLLATVYYALLSNKLDRTHISIGTLFAGRVSQEWENTLGAFVNLLPIIFNYDSMPSVMTMIQDTARQIAKSSDYSFFPIEELDQLTRHTKEHSSLFEFILVFLNSIKPLNDLTVIETHNGQGTDPFILEVREGLQLQLIIKYDQSSFTEHDIERFFAEIVGLLENITFKREDNINGLSISKFEKINPEKNEIGLLSTFTIDPIEPYLNYWLTQLNYPYHFKIGGFNQVIQNLLDEQSFVYQNKANFIFISLHDWLQSDAKIIDLVNELIHALTVYCSKNKQLALLVLTPPPKASPYLKEIQTQEARIKEQLLTTSTILVYTHQDLMDTYSNDNYFNEYTYKQGAIPYTEEFYLSMATFVIRHFACTLRKPKKVVVLDCDNTLWQGVVGEDGVDGLKITSIHAELQQKMKALRKQGFLLALCSKNILNDVKSVFEHRKDMILTWDDFSSYQINWSSKSENIQLIAKELNLGIDSFIFIDDNPVECLEIQQNHPNVEVIQFDKDKDNMADYLNNLWCFDLPKQTKEDSLRADFYATEKAREVIKTESSNLDDFIQRLNVKVVIEEIKDSDYARVSQLTMRTTQFNSSNHQFNEQDISQFTHKSNTVIYTVNVSDNFGDYGLVGVIMLSHQDETLTVDGLWLSCRALGRGVEKQIQDQIMDYGLKHHCETVRFLFKKTDRNMPVELFLKSIGCILKLDAYISALTNKDI